jgi:hypothetical protein
LWKTFRPIAGGPASRFCASAALPVLGTAAEPRSCAVLRACSNCTGDYEDPDRTAADPDEIPGQWEGDGVDESTEDVDARARQASGPIGAPQTHAKL